MQNQKIFYRKITKLLGLCLWVGLLMMITGQPVDGAQAQTEAPLLFIENVGQFPDHEQLRFQVNLGQMTLWLARDALWLTVVEASPLEPETDLAVSEVDLAAKAEPRRGVNFKLSFIGANPEAELEPFNPLPARISYFKGNDPANWQPETPVWGGVRYREFYPGIDLEISGEAGRLVQRLILQETDVAAAEAQPLLQDIHLKIAGADQVTVDQDFLHLTSKLGEVTFPLWQVADANDQPISLPAVQTEVTAEGEITAPFTPLSETEIEPVSPAANIAALSDLQYSTFLGGEGFLESGNGITIDAEGYAYTTGQAYSGFPVTPGVFDPTVEGVFNDIFVAKLSPDGSNLVYATFVGGSDFEASRRIHANEAGEVYIVGNTTSTDFPTTPGAFDSVMDDIGDAFVVKLNADGTALLYSTLFGGTDSDFGWDLAVDEAGHAYVAGTTFSGNFPITPTGFDYIQSAGEAYALKLSPDGHQVLYATYLGGAAGDYGHSIAVDEAGSAYVAGWTLSPDFPLTTGAFDTSYENTEGFVAKLNSDASAFIYSTFIGGDSTDAVNAIAINEAGQAYLTGQTTSADFPLSSDALDTVCGDCGAGYFRSDAFIARLTGDGSGLVYASFLGGADTDVGEDIQVSETGSIYLTGYTYSPDFPTTPDAFDTIYCESCTDPFPPPDVFLTRLDPAGDSLAYSTFLGGQGIDLAGSLAIDPQGQVYLIGSAGSADFPVTEAAFDTSFEGMYDVFVSKLATGSDEAEPEPPLQVHDCGPTPLGEIQVGATPRGVAVDPLRNRVYVANFGGNSVSVIDGATNQLLQTISNIPSANGLSYDETNNLIWVSNYETAQVTPIQANDEATAFTALPPIGVGQGPWGVAYDRVHNYVYVANSLADSVSVIDAATQSVIGTLTGAFNRPFHLAANPVNGKIYVANSGHNSVTLIQETGISKVIQIWDSGRAYGIAVDETRDMVYVATVDTRRIVAIGPLKGKPDQFLGWAAFQRGYNRHRPLPLRAIALNPQLGLPSDGGHLWATTSTGDGSELNQALLIPKGWGGYFHVPFPHQVGVNPTEGIAVNRVTNRVYISSGATPGSLSVIGDHTNICPGIAPAAVPDNEQFEIDIFSTTQLLRSDVNQDGQIDIIDLTFVAMRYDSHEASADLNEDGVVDILDLVIIANHYGQQLPESD